MVKSNGFASSSFLITHKLNKILIVWGELNRFPEGINMFFAQKLFVNFCCVLYYFVEIQSSSHDLSHRHAITNSLESTRIFLLFSSSVSKSITFSQILSFVRNGFKQSCQRKVYHPSINLQHSALTHSPIQLASYADIYCKENVISTTNYNYTSIPDANLRIVSIKLLELMCFNFICKRIQAAVLTCVLKN